MLLDQMHEIQERLWLWSKQRNDRWKIACDTKGNGKPDLCHREPEHMALLEMPIVFLLCCCVAQPTRASLVFTLPDASKSLTCTVQQIVSKMALCKAHGHQDTSKQTSEIQARADKELLWARRSKKK